MLKNLKNPMYLVALAVAGLLVGTTLLDPAATMVHQQVAVVTGLVTLLVVFLGPER